MDIQSVDHIELYVEDAPKSAADLCDSFGFAVAGTCGPRTGLSGGESMLLRQGEIALVVTAPTSSADRVAEFVRRHGDGVAAIGFSVDEAQSAFAESVGRGAVPVMAPQTLGPPGGRVTVASVVGFGDVEHRFISREATGGPLWPGLIEEPGPAASDVGLLRAVDHCAVCVPPGELPATVRAYQDVFGFRGIFEEHIVVGSQAMNSKVVQSPSGKVTFTIIEPDTTRSPGQIDTYLQAHRGAGIQHIAFLADDITAAVRDCTRRGARFLTTPSGYYTALPARLGPVGVPVETLRELNILADHDHDGVMLQIFTESRHPRRTLFYEFVDRRGARTFGSNNIKALYEAVERRRTAEPA